MSCNENGVDTPKPDFTIPAGAAAGSTSQTYNDIPAGSICTATETATGDTSAVTTTITGDNGQPITVPAAATATRHITNTYDFLPGTLTVKKIIRGPGAGQQGEVVIQPTCGGTDLAPFTIAAGRRLAATKTYPVPVNSVCTVTETVDGHTSTVSVAVDGSGQTVTVPAFGDFGVTAFITDAYTLVPGSLTVNKTITGPGAGLQGPVTITVTCVHHRTTTTLQPVITIPAGATTGPSHTYTDIAAGSVCTVIEDPDGSNGQVAVTVKGSGEHRTIPAGSAATPVDIVNTYTTGSLIVNKTITGEAAGKQGEVTIHTECDGTAETPDLVVPAGSPAGTYSQRYPNVAPGATCTVTEPANGSTATVNVVTTVGPPVTITAGGTGTVGVTDTYAFVPGSLTVTKTITGPSAVGHGPITIHVDCGADVLVTDITIAAGVPLHRRPRSRNLPAGTSCTVTETEDGSTSTVAVVVDPADPQTVPIPAGGTATADITDTYSPAPGSLTVTKTIDGQAAGSQGAISIHVVCDGTALTPDFKINAGTAAETTSHTYNNVPAGATCTVTEPVAGSSGTVAVDTVLSPDVTVQAGGVATAEVLDTYTLVPGSLTVTKTIAGPSAGQQGPIIIGVKCGDPGAARVHHRRRRDRTAVAHLPNIPAGLTCTVTEEADGSSTAVGVVTTGSTQDVKIDPNAEASAEVTDTYSPAPGSLTVTKTIDGQAAGSQGAITLHVVCGDTALTPDFKINAGTAAGEISHTYNNVPAGATCTVTEPENGSSGTVAVGTVLSPDVTVPAGGVATAEVLDTYTLVPGSLSVTKTIAGPSAGQQGPIIIGVKCGTLVLPEFTIPAGATGPQSQTYPNIPAGLTCTVTEEADGTSTAVGVVTTGSPQDVKIQANAAASADLTDTYGPTPGSLTVSKTINGPLAGSQGAITISVKCGSTTLPTWTIPAGTGAKTLTHKYMDIPAGSACTVTETSDGATTTVMATVTGANQTLTVPAGTAASLSITDTYSPTAGAIKVMKTLAGPGAGQQGRVGILLVCGGAVQVFTFVIPAGHPGGSVTQVFNNIGGGSTCLVAEVADGHTNVVTVQATDAQQNVTVPAAGIASVDLTDRFSVAVAAAGVPSAPVALAAAGPSAPVALPNTGPSAPIAPLIGLALATILAGAAMTIAARRRKT